MLPPASLYQGLLVLPIANKVGNATGAPDIFPINPQSDYFIELALGTPPQPIRLTLDTSFSKGI
ncbi:hypothetical protein QBC40DRAFT_254931 [Triangularia verruculosa]|uniref:Peptidase A1 domain-containing protein n=1 Tax=Triangularia verruculosa TaxID=2587418 RepID=A0AAN7AUA0_9PEZI|nr:hypothetical protein QBC40DRAFT_254931 [Triangularia verruculosa]